ncbi:S8 family serine peptidase [Rossellomorea sp. y25]|uniref:S8 family serine peptidase n=1 Tax=Rossellomorea sp. y25 TaxID=3118174 RepID=UPI0030E5968C
MNVQSVIKKGAAVVFTTSLLVSPLNPYFSSETADAEEQKAKDILSSLTEEQRKALHTLETSQQTGLLVDPSIRLDADDMTDIIVQFHQYTAKTEVAAGVKMGKTISLSEANERVERSHQKFKKDVEALIGKKKTGKTAYEITHSYKQAFNGVAMSLPANEIEKLLDSDVVKAIWSDKEVEGIQPVKEKAERPIMTSPSHNMETSHTEGFTGEGIKVGVIDTGIDYNHPDLKDAYKGGYDFIDDDADPMETTYEDWKKSGRPEVASGSVYYTLHGTHVAGIIAGQGTSGSEFSVKGVAPGADLYGYRVLGPYGRGTSSDIIAAIDRAVSDGMDVINLSLGAEVNDPLYPTSVAVNNAVLAGVTSVVAAGNSGSGMKTLGSPATATLALSVGANDVDIVVNTFTGTVPLSNGSADVELRLMAQDFSDAMSGWDGQSLEVVDVGLGQNADYQGKDMKGKAVLVSRGAISFSEKIKLAKNAGASAILLFNDNKEEGHIPYYLGESVHYLPTFSLTNQDGLKIKDGLTDQSEMVFSEAGSILQEGGTLADFSSRGPSRSQYEIKPEVTAPGVQVLSTVPAYANGADYLDNYDSAYQRLSGTSMASPYVAGVAALLLEQNPEYTPEEIKTLLMNTADPLKKDYSVFEAGSGQVDPIEALSATSSVMVDNPSVTIMDGAEKEINSPSGALNFGLSIKDGASFIESRSIQVKNTEKHTKIFDVDIEFQTEFRGSKDASENGVVLNIDKRVKVKGNSTKNINAFITAPKTAEPGTYEGMVTFRNKADKNESYRVPFAFVVMEEGINYAKTTPKALTGDYDLYYPFVPLPGLFFNLKSPMKTIDVLLVDGKTDAELGYLGSMNTSSLIEDTEYYIGSVFNGTYFPFTGNEDQPISATRVKVPYGAGHYKVKMIATTKEGKSFEMADHTIIDLTGAQFETDVNEGVIEYEPGMESYTVTGSVVDRTYEKYQEEGVDIDQTGNFVMVKSGGPYFTDGFYTDENGEFEYSIPLNPSINSLDVALQGYNSSGLGEDYKYYTFVKEGTPYMEGTLGQKHVRMGETTKITLTANNLSNAKELTSSFTFKQGIVDITDVNIHPEFTEMGASISSDYLATGSSTKLTIHAEIPNGVSGDVPVAEVTVKVKSDSYERYLTFENTKTNFINNEGETISMVSTITPMFIIPTFSKISGSLAAPESLQKEDGRPGWRFGLDPSQLGASLTVKDQEGNEYPGSINRYAQTEVQKLPLTMDQMIFSVDIPGHFTVHTPFNVGYKDDDGNPAAQWNSGVSTKAPTPGDVNKDDVIDVLDALEVEKHWGTNERSADINFDGTVNEKDMSFTQKHYLKQNPTVESVHEPKESVEGRSLEDILISLGIQ